MNKGLYMFFGYFAIACALIATPIGMVSLGIIMGFCTLLPVSDGWVVVTSTLIYVVCTAAVMHALVEIAIRRGSKATHG